MAPEKPKANDQTSLPFVALKLLAPPVRLVSAALWKVIRERDVMQYGIVEEFVTSACENVPGLLTFRHQAKLTLGLRARIILELCTKQPDPKEIAVHMKRIQVPVPSSSSALMGRRDAPIHKAVENFHAFIPILLTDTAERERFFKENFPVEYGPKYDQELEKLLWEFLIRLDQLLPVPNLAQTVSWLSDAPPVLEECARAATQPQLLKIILKHENCLGHLEAAASLPPNMGDSILASLSLPPSGKVPSNHSTRSNIADQSTASVCPQAACKATFVKPVIGPISNENVPVMISATKHVRSGETNSTNDENSEGLSESNKNLKFTGDTEGASVSQVEDIRSGMKRKHIDGDAASDDEESILTKARCLKKRTTKKFDQIEEDYERKLLDKRMQMCLNDLGVRKLQIPDNCEPCSTLISCLERQPKVVIKRLNSASDQNTKHHKPRSNSFAKINMHMTTASVPISDNKENTPILSRSSLQTKSKAELQDSLGESEDYVADSEDEATKNFKGRLFAKRYYKTKHGTYVPTLREYWKPCVERRNLLGPGSKHR